MALNSIDIGGRNYSSSKFVSLITREGIVDRNYHVLLGYHISLALLGHVRTWRTHIMHPEEFITAIAS